MIKANELRIGNLVGDSDYIANPSEYDEIKVLIINGEENTICSDYADATPCDDLYGIPLTPEWLERCGFEDIGSCWFHRGEPSFGLLKDNEGGMYIGNPVRTYVKTVHQLQNLYFFLTEGVELNVKL